MSDLDESVIALLDALEDEVRNERNQLVENFVVNLSEDFAAQIREKLLDCLVVARARLEIGDNGQSLHRFLRTLEK